MLSSSERASTSSGEVGDEAEDRMRRYELNSGRVVSSRDSTSLRDVLALLAILHDIPDSHARLYLEKGVL